MPELSAERLPVVSSMGVVEGERAGEEACDSLALSGRHATAANAPGVACLVASLDEAAGGDSGASGDQP